ncbi:MAG: cupin [Chloroflexi bacterium]|nr:cupin [Chloroflexota bacterium]
MATAQSLLKRTFDTPDETRPAGSGRAEIVRLGGVTFMRTNLPAGWRWSKDVKPIARTDSCQATHVGYVLSGRMHVVMDDGAEADFGPGDLMLINPGHDAWITGTEPYVGLDIAGSDVWAKPQ